MRLFLEGIKRGFWRKNLEDLEKDLKEIFFQVESRFFVNPLQE